MIISYTFHKTPIGRLRLRATNAGLIAVDHTNQQEGDDSEWIENATHPILQQATRELDEYFAGKRTSFDTPLAPVGTDFQLQVWNALRQIPFGETASYSDIGHILENPKAVRAIGAANGRNPLSIFIPCHRIIGKNGTLTGYAGGLENKKTLLELEQQSNFTLR